MESGLFPLMSPSTGVAPFLWEAISLRGAGGATGEEEAEGEVDGLIHAW